MLSELAEKPVETRTTTSVLGDGSGPFLVRDVSDLVDLMGGCCSMSDVRMLWRLLVKEGSVRHEADHSVIDLPTETDLRARCTRARIASRRERSSLAQWQ